MTSPESDQSPDSPEFNILLGGEKHVMTWHNTIVRQFGVGDCEFDHIVVVGEDCWMAFRADEAVIQLLLDRNFPRTWGPILDEDAVDCLAACQMLELESELPLDG